MSGIRVERRRFDEVNKEMRQAAEAALGDAGEHLLEESNRTVPIEEGTLGRSGEVSRDGLTVQVGYSGPYAVAQHERLDYRHDQGRRAKWLESTFKERANDVARMLANRLRKVR